MNWTEEEITTLKQLWVEGVAVVNIGAKLNRGRNSIIGMAHRLALPQHKESNHNKNRTAPHAPRVRVKRPATPLEAPAVPTGDPIKFCELRHRHCRAVVGRDEKGLATYCGAPTMNGHSWCEYHSGIYLIPGRSNVRGGKAHSASQRNTGTTIQSTKRQIRRWSVLPTR